MQYLINEREIKTHTSSIIRCLKHFKHTQTTKTHAHASTHCTSKVANAENQSSNLLPLTNGKLIKKIIIKF